MVFIAMATTSVCQRKGSAGALRFLRTVSVICGTHRTAPRFYKTHYTYSRPQESQLSAHYAKWPDVASKHRSQNNSFSARKLILLLQNLRIFATLATKSQLAIM